MAARGAIAKQQIFKKIMEIYPNAFFEEEDKILRIPIEENADHIEIKLQLTAAKNNLGGAAVASAFPTPSSDEIAGYMPAPTGSAEDIEISEEEKQRVSQLLASLGL